MGALPIVLALSGFVLLWAIVNYNSFSDKKANIQRMLRQRADLLRERNEILTKLAALFQTFSLFLPLHFEELLKNPEKLSARSPMEEALAQMNASARNFPALLHTTKFQELKTDLVTNTNQLLKLQTSLTAAVNNYNKHATSMPYRIVATVFGFKPVEVY